MRNLKRALSLVLAAAMLVGMMVVSASAAGYDDFTDKSEIVNTEAVATLVALNVINGKEDGSYFDPTGMVTRAEMAKMITVALHGGKDPVLGVKDKASFTDIKGTWAEQFIEYCASPSVGSISGRGNGKFDPTGTVTGSEAAKMLLVTLGYGAKVYGLTGANWEINTNVLANTVKLYEDLDIKASAGLTRDNAAQMIFNALNSDMVELRYSQNVATGEITQSYVPTGKTLLATKYGTSEKIGQMTGISYNAEKGEYTYTITGVTDPIVTKTDASDLFGMNVKVIYKTVNGKTTVFGIFAEKSVVLAETVVGSINLTKVTERTLSVGTTTYKTEGTSANIFAAFNNSTELGTTVAAPAAAYYSAKLIDKDGNGKVDFIVYVPVTIGKVGYVGKNSMTVDTTYGAASSYSFTTTEVYEGAAKDDYVVITAAANLPGTKAKVEKLDSKVTGKITEITKYDTVTPTSATALIVDGSAYKVADISKDVIQKGNIGKEINAASYNGFLFYTAAASAASGVANFAMVVKAENAASGLNAYPQAILLMTSGEKVTVNTAVGYNSLENKLVKCTVNANGTYTLTEAITSMTGTGYDFTGSAADKAYTQATADIDGNKIANDAVFFVKDALGAWTTITGADLKTKGGQTVKLYYSVKDKSTGFSTVVLGYIDAAVAAGNTNYGYIVSDVTTVNNAANTAVGKFQLWTGTEVVTVTTSNAYDTLSGYPKGSLISYTDLGDNIITVAGPGLTESAVLAYDGANIRFAGGIASSGKVAIGTAKNLKITDKTVILYVDAAAKTGIEGGSIRLATETTTSGTFYTNAAYKSADGTNVDVLVIEVNNNYSNVTIA